MHSFLMGRRPFSQPASWTEAARLLSFLGLILTMALCLVSSPRVALAQGDERSVVVLDIEGSKAKEVNEKFRALLKKTSFTTVDHDDFVAAAKAAGVSGDEFWKDSANIAKVCKASGYTAVVVTTMVKEKKQFHLKIEVMSGSSGDVVGSFQVNIGKKKRIGSDDKDKIIQKVEELVDGLDSVSKTNTVAKTSTGARVGIRIITTPPGVTVFRDNMAAGTTPTTIVEDASDAFEEIEFRVGGKVVGSLQIDLSKNGTYNVALDGVEVEGSDDDAPGILASSDGVGSGQALIELGVGARSTFRSLGVDQLAGNGASLMYDSSLYFVYALDLAFYPFVLATDGALSGLGLTGRAGYGPLESKIPTPVGVVLDAAPDCTASGDLLTCPTTHVELAGGLVFRALFSDTAEGTPDPDGLAANLAVEYSMMTFDVAENPVYEGHGYSGARITAGFATPLGVSGLKLDLHAFVMPLFGFGDATMLEDWGDSASGIGFGGDLAVSYTLLDSLVAQVGYSLEAYQTAYDGIGCQYGSLCGYVSGGVANDFFHQVGVHISYRAGL